MADTLAELAVKITADTAGLNEGLTGVKEKLSSFGGVAKKAGTVLAGVGIAAVSAGVASVSSFATMADNLDEMSTRTGLSTTTLQELGYAAKLTGSSMDGMEGAVKKMQIGIEGADASAGGLEGAMASLKGLDVQTQFEMMADLIAEIQDPTERAAAAVAIFGKSGTDLIPMMEGGSKGLQDFAKEANAAGVVMDEASVKSGATFKDSLDKLEMSLGGVVNQIGSKLIPVLEPLIPAFVELIKALPLEQFGKLIANLLPPLVDLLIKLLDAIPLDKMLKFVDAALTPLLNILEAILPILEPILDLFGSLLQILEPVLDIIGAILEGVADILGSGIGWIMEGIAGGVGGIANEINGYASGGIVPGTGPQLAMVHGGETIIPAGGGGAQTIQLFIDGEQVSNVVEKRLYDRLRYQEIQSY